MSRNDVIKWDATHDIETEGIPTHNSKPEPKLEDIQQNRDHKYMM
jgi:hypothetical protein